MKGTTWIDWAEVISITPEIEGERIGIVFKRDDLTWRGEVEKASQAGLEVYVY